MGAGLPQLRTHPMAIPCEARVELTEVGVVVELQMKKVEAVVAAEAVLEHGWAVAA